MLETHKQARRNLWSNYARAREEVDTAKAALNNLREEKKKDEQEEATSNTWSGYFASFLVSTTAGEEAKVMRERRAIQRLHAWGIRERDLNRSDEKMKSLLLRITAFDGQIRATESKIELEKQVEWGRQEARRQAERKKVSEEIRKRQEEADRMWEQEVAQERRRKEEAEKARRRQQEAAEERRLAAIRKIQMQEIARREKKREEEEDKVRRWEQQETADERRKQQESAKERRQQQEASRRHATPRQEPNAGHRGEPRRPGGTSEPCSHQGYWNRIQGRGVCSHCHTVQGLFTFRCPGCQTVACVSCMKFLRGH